MQSDNVYITIGLDKKGNVQEVRVDGKKIEPRESHGGELREGGNAPGCEEVAKKLVHELLTCKKKGDKPPTGSGGGGSTRAAIAIRAAGASGAGAD